MKNSSICRHGILLPSPLFGRSTGIQRKDTNSLTIISNVRNLKSSVIPKILY